MTNTASLAAILASLLTLAAAPVPPRPTAAEHDLKKTTLAIQGMTCGGCVAAVKHRLGKVRGVTAFEVSLEKARADVKYDPGLVDPEAIAAAVSETGFKATVRQAPGGKDGEDERKDE